MSVSYHCASVTRPSKHVRERGARPINSDVLKTLASRPDWGEEKVGLWECNKVSMDSVEQEEKQTDLSCERQKSEL